MNSRRSITGRQKAIRLGAVLSVLYSAHIVSTKYLLGGLNLHILDGFPYVLAILGTIFVGVAASFGFIVGSIVHVVVFENYSPLAIVAIFGNLAMVSAAYLSWNHVIGKIGLPLNFGYKNMVSLAGVMLNAILAKYSVVGLAYSITGYAPTYLAFHNFVTSIIVVVPLAVIFSLVLVYLAPQKAISLRSKPNKLIRGVIHGPLTIVLSLWLLGNSLISWGVYVLGIPPFWFLEKNSLIPIISIDSAIKSTGSGLVILYSTFILSILIIPHLREYIWGTGTAE